MRVGPAVSSQQGCYTIFSSGLKPEGKVKFQEENRGIYSIIKFEDKLIGFKGQLRVSVIQ